ncbi:MAG: winged helix-turn-helix transcriptional regulator [Candidatus Sericytochromatia bacterium]|nr:winged helix-turn-helix transcriptional regulator [Candidatus Sericytochromatia bacterium]
MKTANGTTRPIALLKTASRQPRRSAVPVKAPDQTDVSLAQATVLAKAVAEETRLRLLMLLQPQELCACQIVEVFELANSTISKHLSLLKQAGLLASRKSGRWIYYRWPDPSDLQDPAVDLTLQWVQALLQSASQTQVDREQVQQILQLDPVALCLRQRGGDCC